MKTVPNRQFTEKLSTAILLQNCLKTPPDGGFSFDSMRKRIRVAAVADAVKPGGEICLEDADFATAVDAIQSTRWNVMDPHIIDFAAQFGL